MARPPTYEAQIQLPSGPATYRVRQSRRAKRLLLKVDLRQGIEVVVPRRISLRAAEKFMWQQRAWLMRTIAKQQRLAVGLVRREFVTGEMLPLLDEQVALVVNRRDNRRRARVTYHHGQILVQLPPDTPVRPVLVAWYRDQARQYFLRASTRSAEQLGVAFSRVTIGDQKTKWGSCSAAGRLSYNWRLLLAPAPIASYVVAHEISHLRHRNHSAEFWRTLTQLDPEYRVHKTWLKTNGHTLFL